MQLMFRLKVLLLRIWGRLRGRPRRPQDETQQAVMAVRMATGQMPNDRDQVQQSQNRKD